MRPRVQRICLLLRRCTLTSLPSSDCIPLSLSAWLPACLLYQQVCLECLVYSWLCVLLRTPLYSLLARFSLNKNTISYKIGRPPTFSANHDTWTVGAMAGIACFSGAPRPGHTSHVFPLKLSSMPKVWMSVGRALRRPQIW